MVLQSFEGVMTQTACVLGNFKGGQMLSEDVDWPAP